ncbi:YrdB family protein [Streptomyces sp. NPDC051452]|uniref:YrdB family protein n=1 Tax=Streptomyces sp. NPDC051452 TaxID=3365654 RepID=UPI00378E406A
MKAAKTANLGVLFLVELAALAAAAYWGLTRGTAVDWLLGVLAPAVLAGLWALCGSPRARFRARGASRVAFEVLWFGAGAVALCAAGAYGWALAFVAVCLSSKGLAVAWDQ